MNIVPSQFTCQIGDIANKVESDQIKAVNLPSLSCLLSNKVMGKDMVERVAASGLQFGHLQLAFKRSNEDGIRKIFSEINSIGKARVMKSKKIISSVNEYLSKQQK